MVWYVIDEEKMEIEIVRKKMIYHLPLLEEFLMISDNRIIVTTKIHGKKETKYILSIDLETNEESYYLLPKSCEIYYHRVVNDYLFLTFTNRMHVVLNIYTLNEVKKLFEF